MIEQEETLQKCVVLVTSKNSEKAYGPFFSFQEAHKVLEEKGFVRINDHWWQRREGMVDAYIKHLNNPNELVF